MRFWNRERREDEGLSVLPDEHRSDVRSPFRPCAGGSRFGNYSNATLRKVVVKSAPTGTGPEWGALGSSF